MKSQQFFDNITRVLPDILPKKLNGDVCLSKFGGVGGSGSLGPKV